jgi:hypothetical protein
MKNWIHNIYENLSSTNCYMSGNTRHGYGLGNTVHVSKLYTLLCKVWSLTFKTSPFLATKGMGVSSVVVKYSKIFISYTAIHSILSHSVSSSARVFQCFQGQLYLSAWVYSAPPFHRNGSYSAHGSLVYATGRQTAYSRVKNCTVWHYSCEQWSQCVYTREMLFYTVVPSTSLPPSGSPLCKAPK